ncbi:hypothetical protein Tco_0054878, partial [Tanacetum coccineum]
DSCGVLENDLGWCHSRLLRWMPNEAESGLYLLVNDDPNPRSVL